MIRLRFITEFGFESWAIRFLTLSSFSHVDLVMPNGYLGARMDGGVKLRPFDYCKPTREVFCHINCSPEDTKKALGWASKQIGKPYDWMGIIAMPFIARDYTDPGQWVCSELVACCVRQVIPQFINKTSNRITPQDDFQDSLIVLDK